MALSFLVFTFKHLIFARVKRPAHVPISAHNYVHFAKMKSPPPVIVVLACLFLSFTEYVRHFYSKTFIKRRSKIFGIAKLARNIKFRVNFSPPLFCAQAIFQGMEIVIRGLSPHLFWVTRSVRGGARPEACCLRDLLRR